jgi:Malectin domain
MVSFVEPSKTTRPSTTATTSSTTSSHSYDDGYMPPQAPPIKEYTDSVMIDVTMEDDSELYDSYDYPREVAGIDPKQRAMSSQHGRGRGRGRWCGWMPLCLVVGWIATLVLAVQLFVVRQDYRKFRSQLEVLFPDDDSNNEDELYPKDSPNSSPYRDTASFTLRINAGSSRSYTDNQKRGWLADAVELGDDKRSDIKNIQGETIFTVMGDGYLYDTTVAMPETIYTPILNDGVEGQGLYRDERYFETYGRYDIHVPTINNWYRVDLFFCEFFYQEEGERLMDLLVQGEKIRSNYDIMHETNGQNFTAVVVSHSVYVREPTISIELKSVKNEPKINGIQVQAL